MAIATTRDMHGLPNPCGSWVRVWITVGLPVTRTQPAHTQPLTLCPCTLKHRRPMPPCAPPRKSCQLTSARMPTSWRRHSPSPSHNPTNLRRRICALSLAPSHLDPRPPTAYPPRACHVASPGHRRRTRRARAHVASWPPTAYSPGACHVACPVPPVLASVRALQEVTRPASSSCRRLDNGGDSGGKASDKGDNGKRLPDPSDPWLVTCGLRAVGTGTGTGTLQIARGLPVPIPRGHCSAAHYSTEAPGEGVRAALGASPTPNKVSRPLAPL